MRELFQGASVSEADTAKTMLSTLNETGEVIDPHTAVGVAAANACAGRSHHPGGGAVDRPPGQVPRGRRGGRGLTPATPRATPDLSKKPKVRNPAGRRRNGEGLRAVLRGPLF
jgi:threonine synthase